MIRILILALWSLLIAAGPAAAAEMQCVPLSGSARILASADAEDIDPSWEDGRIGLAWTLVVSGREEGEDGETYYYGDLIDPKGASAGSGVYIMPSEWDCG